MTRTSRGEAFFWTAALGFHTLVALTLRATAWPELTTPAYLMTRGFLLYRDVKFVHTPGLMAAQALFFAIFGVRASALKLFFLLWPLAAHGSLLAATRRLSWPGKILSSLLFLVLFYGWQGNSNWPSTAMAALALPVAFSLGGRRLRRAGLLIGLCILLKQTAAYLLLLVLARLLFHGRLRDSATVLLFSTLPYAATIALFACFSAAGEFLKWTLIVPFTTSSETVRFHPGLALWIVLASSFLPLALAALLEKDGKEGTDSRWLLIVAAGLALLIFPNFGFFQAVGATPCLALGAGRLLSRGGTVFKIFSYGLAVTLVASRGLILLAGETFDGKIFFWNEDPSFNALADRLRSAGQGEFLYTTIWGNLLPRTGMVPPGRTYVHPWLYYYHGVDGVGLKARREAERPGTWIVETRSRASPGERFGPYSISRR
jgi:hypothetical protein